MLREAMRQGRRPEAGAALVGDVMHEVAEVADPMTQASLGACFRECLKRSQGGEDSRWPAFSRLVASSRMPANSRVAASVRELDAAYSLV
jgi:hypothetical protein